ncbi:hypothetical protein KGD83_13635 [Nocardiopsis akebiae]|uniref:Secreted protein n=1 Tax=Nocardiopsis akebiae TaxID=2831968 RepID=A0ABX8CC38_9ACTN|nr:hypothetical protein [Nocardiopsis akebiae]QUX31435.1 hypothetical protein KGD83_13635 [Nocardiopsis akebiae]
MTLAIFVAVAVTVAVVVDTLAPMGSRSGLGVRRGAARRALTALRRGLQAPRVPAPAVEVQEPSVNRAPEPRRETEPAGLGITVAPSRTRRTRTPGPARTGRPRRAAAKASLS